MKAEHNVLLLRWLSRGKVLTRVFEIRDIIKIFLQEQGSNLFQDLMDPKFRAHIISHLKTLQVNFEGYFESHHPSFNAWVSLFSVSLEQIGDNDPAKDELIDLRQN